MNYKPLSLLSIGHLVTDINQGALPAMLPFFIAAYDLSFAAAAGIVFAANMTSSVVQPLFGHAADRFSKPWLLLLGLMLAGAGLGLTGVSQSYRWTLIWAIVSGVGIAAYHPEAARLVNFAAGAKKGTAMSLFGVGGTLGFAMGPLVITTALMQWGLKGALVLLVPVSLMSVAMATQLSLFESLEVNRRREQASSCTASSNDDWGAFIRLTITIILRSILFYGLNTFIPIYWIHGLNQSKVAGAMALTIFASSGIFGNVLGGSIADRIGPKKMILIGLFGLTLLLPLFIWVKSVQIASLLLVPIGMMLYATYSPSIVLGQIYLPNRVGFSSGITLGVAVAMGGAAAPVIGTIADLHGVWYAMASMAGLPILIVIIALGLPSVIHSQGV
jgi:FSR family fosmidomycin resistance protein-like MFS transporter